MKNERALAYAAFATVCVVWGTTYLAIRIAVETLPPLLLTGGRFTLAGLLLLAIAHARGEVLPRAKRTLLDLAIIGVLMVCVGNLAVVWAEQWVPSGMAALLVAGSPFWAAMIELFRRGGERLSPRRAAGMLLGFAGVALLVAPGGPAGSFDVHFVLGALAIQIGGLSWQLGTVRAKYTLKGVQPLTSSALQMLFGGAIVTLAGVAIGESSRFVLTPRTFAAWAYLTIFGSVVAYTAYVYALFHISTTNLALYAYINPVVAVILGWLILDERLTWLSLLAMLVILGGVALCQLGGRPGKTTPGVAQETTARRDAA